MIDFKRYYRLHPLGLCKVVKNSDKGDDQYIVLFKRFDNETGAELSPEPHYFSTVELAAEKENILQQLSAISIIEDSIKNM